MNLEKKSEITSVKLNWTHCYLTAHFVSVLYVYNLKYLHFVFQPEPAIRRKFPEDFQDEVCCFKLLVCISFYCVCIRSFAYYL